MARPASIALGGYFKTPTELVPMIAKLFQVDQTRGNSRTIIVDPCAGTGEAVTDLAAMAVGNIEERASIYTCELERGRYETTLNHYYFSGWRHTKNALHGDAFLLDWGDRPRADILYLNPPYDADREHERLEHRFLMRFTPILRPGEGWLCFVVPYYVLGSSAEYLATHYDNLHIYRFPDPEFAHFRQVVVVGRRLSRPRPVPSQPIIRQVNAWADNPTPLVPLSYKLRPLAVITPGRDSSLKAWKINEIDVAALYEMSLPFHTGKFGSWTPMAGMGLEAQLTDLVGQKFPVLLPPSAAHIALMLASGLMNGSEIRPNIAAAHLPPLMVKGTFRRDFKTVEEKKNKDGDTTSVIQVQQPELQVSVLDMWRWTYHDLKKGNEPTGAAAVPDMNVADLLVNYGEALIELMQTQCPPLHNPTEYPSLDLPPMGLEPYAAQAKLITATLKQMVTTAHPFTGQNAFILGEVGTGKTLISMAVCEAFSRRHLADTLKKLAAHHVELRPRIKPLTTILVVRPPHLVADWFDQSAKILPGAECMVLESVGDVDRAAALPAPPLGSLPGSGIRFLILSREKAKLGHGWVVGLDKRRRCPACGHVVSGSDKEILSGRKRCEHRQVIPANEWAGATRQMASWLSSVSDDEHLAPFLGRYQSSKKGDQAKWNEVAAAPSKPLAQTRIHKLIQAVGNHALSQLEKKEWAAKDTVNLLGRLLMSFTHPDRDETLLYWAMTLYAAASVKRDRYTGNEIRDLCRAFLLIASDPGSRGVLEAMAAMQAFYHDADWLMAEKHIQRIKAEYEGRPLNLGNIGYSHTTYTDRDESGRPVLVSRLGWNDETVTVGSIQAALYAFRGLSQLAEFEQGDECGEALFAAAPTPRRFPLADYIASRHPNLFDLFILDEAHEYNHDGTAQERAAHRLVQLGKPVLPLTGTSNNGYASSMFANMWAFSQHFRREFGRDDISLFVTRYGYRKIRIDPADEGKFIPANFGSQSDRVDTGVNLKMRKIGEAPGVLPLFTLKHLLPIGAIIHKEDLDADLPPMVEIPHPLVADDELKGQHDHLKGEVIKQIMADLRNSRHLAGKLWGQLAQLPTYLDRAAADTGNTGEMGERRFEIAYPDSVGGRVVATAKPLDIDLITAKEQWTLDTIEAELDEGRPVMLMVWNTRSGLADRLHRLVESRIGKHVTTLDTERVAAVKRQGWIDANVIGKRRRVLIVNPRAIETGLNNLVYFPTAIWFQNPNCSPIVYAQANGRVHRPGQYANEVRIHFPYYKDTVQELQLILLGHKVAASRQTDGLDITSALAAAGASSGEDSMSSLSVGQALYEMIVGQQTKPMMAHFKPVEGNGAVYKNGNGHAAATPPLAPTLVPPPEKSLPVLSSSSRRVLQPRLF